MIPPFVYHHLGLGDHFICNAIVRHYEKKYGMINLFAKHHNAVSVKAMYRDIDVNVVAVKDDAEAEKILSENYSAKVFKIGFTDIEHTENYEEMFYRLADVPFNMKWDGFKYESDSVKPPELIPPDKPYKFIHQDVSRGFKIRDKYFDNNDMLVIEQNRNITDNILLWDDILKNAEEIHCIESCFMFFADLIPTKGKLFVHRYARKMVRFEVPKMRKDWNIII